MARRTNYGFEKRQREQRKKRKKREKAERREEATSPSPDDDEAVGEKPPESGPADGD